MQRVIDEMAKAKGDIEKRYRNKIPEIIRECMAFAYLGKSFTFDANAELDRKVNQKLIALSDEIMEDIEARAKRCIEYAEDEEDEDAILAYMKREQNGEDLLSRIDKHNSNFRYFLEGWMAIGIVNGLSQGSLLANIMTYMANPYISPLWQDAFKEGYLSNSIRTRGYSFGKGNMRNPIDALMVLAQDSINRAFQQGRFLRFGKVGAIGYTIHRGSSFDCPYCDSFTGIVHPMTENLLPLHPRCVCYSIPVYPSNLANQHGDSVTNLLAAFRSVQHKSIRDPFRGKVFADPTGGLLSSLPKTIVDLINDYYKYQYNSARVSILKQIVSKPDFKRLAYYSNKNNSIFSVYTDFAQGLKLKEMPKNLRIASKYLNNGFDVYILPNVRGVKSADFIVVKKGKYYYIEGKEFDGYSTLGARIKDGATQSDRVVIDVVGNQTTSYVYSEIKNAFNSIPSLSELHLFKGNRIIFIKRGQTLNEKRFKKYFKELWDSQK